MEGVGGEACARIMWGRKLVWRAAEVIRELKRPVGIGIIVAVLFL